MRLTDDGGGFSAETGEVEDLLEVEDQAGRKLSTVARRLAIIGDPAPVPGAWRAAPEPAAGDIAGSTSSGRGGRSSARRTPRTVAAGARLPSTEPDDGDSDRYT